MTRHFIIMLLIISAMLICMFLPFFPGRYDGLAVTLSSISQVMAIGGLLLVPIGVLWLIFKRYQFAIASLVVGSILVFAILAVTVETQRLSVGFIVIILYSYFVFRVVRRIKHVQASAAWYLILIPIITALFQLIFIVPATHYSINRAIEKSRPLIDGIEAFYQRNGHYPVSLLALHQDYEPYVMGISQYHYEVNGNAYNLYFEQFSPAVGVREIIMYNKLGEHVMTSHDADLLELTTQQLNVQRGYFEERDLPQPNWRRFLFD